MKSAPLTNSVWSEGMVTILIGEPVKAPSPTVEILPQVNFVMLLQPLNADAPIEITELARVTVSSAVKFLKADAPIEVTPSATLTVLILSPSADHAGLVDV